jgi:MFS superfamily sulfate permease-like transporter
MSCVEPGEVNFIDTTACDALLSIITEMQSRGITFAFARMYDPVRDRMRRYGSECDVAHLVGHLPRSL